MEWVNALVQGLLLGGLYALLACGLSLVFGVMRTVNIAHGDLAVFAEGAGRAHLVEAHKARIARHVGGQYRRQSADDPARPLLHHGARKSLRAMVVL